MNSTIQKTEEVNYVHAGEGAPVLMIHGLAASLHDWDFLLPDLAASGYAGYALDLLGHGGSPKPDARAYEMEWLFDQFAGWVGSLGLDQPAVLIGHSLGGYLALEYARRFAGCTRGLVLVDPFYSLSQLPALLRFSYRRPHFSGLMAGRAPQWVYRMIIDLTSLAMGRGGALHMLPEAVRAQTALDYTRAAPGVYNLPGASLDLTPFLRAIEVPALVIWGDRDQTLAPASFRRLAEMLPRAQGKPLSAGHVPHQSHAGQVNCLILDFLKQI